jgi:hypothetical protein
MAQDVISDGLAVGYFYNFIKRLFDLLGEETVGRTEQTTYPFAYSEVQLTVVLPAVLAEDVIERSRELVYNQSKLRLIAESGRDMSVFVEKLDTEQKVVLDYPTTLGAVIDYLSIDNEEITGFAPLSRTSEEWQARTELELKRFREVLEYLVSSYPATADKVAFRIVE